MADAAEVAETYLADVSEEELSAMLEAGSLVLECFRVLANTDDSIVGELLKTEEEFYEWEHYPDGDVYDSTSHSQYYYHAHPPAERPGEHGHFHTFMRPDGMPEGVEPARVPDFEPPEDPDDALSHIIAISMSSKGFPLKMFTTNRWVTDEVWYEADDVCRFVQAFEIDHTQPSWPVNVWISNFMLLFRPQIYELLRTRDETIAAWSADHPDTNVFCDHDLEVTSEMEVDIDAQMAAIALRLGLQG